MLTSTVGSAPAGAGAGSASDTLWHRVRVCATEVMTMVCPNCSDMEDKIEMVDVHGDGSRYACPKCHYAENR